MRAAPITWTTDTGIPYAHTDYARLVKAQGGVVVVNDAEDGETARQKLTAPAPDAVLGLGPNASCTKAAQLLLAEQGIRVISTVGRPSIVQPLEDVYLAYAQARVFTDPARRADAARRLYLSRFVDSPLVAGTPIDRLRRLEADLTEETYAKFVKRFKPSRFKRHPAGTDATNRAITMAESAVLAVATSVCQLQGLSTALGVVATTSRLAFADDLARAFQMDVTIPVGFIVGAQKAKPDVAEALVAEQLHHHRLIPSMIQLVLEVLLDG